MALFLTAGLASYVFAETITHHGFKNPNGWKEYVTLTFDNVDGVYYSFEDDHAVVMGSGWTETYYSETSDYLHTTQHYFFAWNSASYGPSLSIPSEVEFEGKIYPVTEIGECAFYGCENLEELIIPSSITSIHPNQIHAGENMSDDIYSCPPKLSTITVDARNTHFKVRDKALIFTDDNSVIMASADATQIPEGVSYINSPAYFCNDIIAHSESIKIPNSVKGISTIFCNYENNSALNSIWHGSVDWISIEAGPYPPSIGWRTFNNIDYKACTVYVPKGSKRLYEKAYIWNNFTHIEEVEIECTDVSTMDKIIYAEDVRQWQGKEVQLPIRLKSLSNDVCGLEFEVQLPSGVRPVVQDGQAQITLSEDVPADFTLQSSYKSEIINVVAYSTEAPSTGINHGDAVVAYLKLYIDEKAEIGETPIVITGTKLNFTNNSTDITMSEAKVTSKLFVPPFMQGDANGDNDVNVGDITIIINAMYGIIYDNYLPQAADVDGNGVTIDDVVAIIDKILNRYNAAWNSAARRIRPTGEHSTLLPATAGQELRLPIALGGDQIGSFQLDIQLPQGFSVARYEMADAYAETHQLMASYSADNSLRLLCFTMDTDACLNPADEVAYVVIRTDAELADDTYSITLRDVVTSGGNQTQWLDGQTFDVSLTSPSGIESLRTEGIQQPSYDLMGRRHSQTMGSVEVINGRKVIGL